MWSFLVFLKGEKNFGVFVVCCCCCCCAGQQRTRQQVIMGDVSVGDGDLESFGDLTEEGEFLERNFPADEAVNVVAEAMEEEDEDTPLRGDEESPLIGSPVDDDDEYSIQQGPMEMNNRTEKGPKKKKSKKEKKRKPYTPEDPQMRLRMRYYYKLAEKTEDKTYFILPAHVIPVTNKTSDGVMIFNLWTTMMGSSLLAMPWGLEGCGWILGMLLIFLWGAMCCYTCLLVVRHGTRLGQTDFCYVSAQILGPWAKYAVWGSSIGILFGSLIAFSVLMSEILFEIVNGIHLFINEDWLDEYSDAIPDVVPGSVYWNSKYAALVVFFLVFPISNLNNFDIFVRVNSFGIISVIYTLIYLVVASYGFEGIEPGEVQYVGNGFLVMAAMLTVSFFMHSIILPIMSTAKNPENNERNITIAFFLVASCYTIVGISGAFAYGPHYVTLPQIILDVFELDDPFAFISRTLFFLQLFAVYPLILLLVRVQFFDVVKLENLKIPVKFRVAILNFSIVLIGALFAAFYPNFGRVLSVTGGICGLLLVFIMPIACHLKYQSETISKAKFYASCGLHGGILLLGFTAGLGQFVYPWNYGNQ